jgi:polyisoprenyl-phosphate glycosyltransferase
MNFTIVVPCFNEEGNIPGIISQFAELLKDRRDVKIIIVNNGSLDNSYQLLEESRKKVSFLDVLHIKKNI